MKTTTSTTTDERIDATPTHEHKHDKQQDGCCGKHKGQHKKARHSKSGHKGGCGQGKKSGKDQHSDHTEHAPEKQPITD